MCSTRAVAFLVLSACAGSIVRAPTHIPADGKVECTDSMQTPLTELGVSVASGGALAIAATDPKGTIENGGMLWAPLLGIVALEFLYGAAEGAASVNQCRAAERRGAEMAERARQQAEARSEARAEAGTLWKRAATAARADDCATVRELDPQVRNLDVELHDVVFMRDVAISRCLASPQ